jgi:hypothetical protein
MEIRLVKKENLDKIKWNSCVHYALNGNVFGYKWFLDSVSKEWDALVEGDYESVFPLFHTNFDYSNYHQKLIKESVIYSIHLLSQKRILAFIEAIPTNYKNIDIQFKNGIQLPANKNFELKQIKSHHLFLQSPYDTIQNNYSETLKDSLNNAKHHKLKPISSLKPEKIAALFKENSTKSKETEAAFHAYQRIMYNAMHRGWGFASGIVDEKNNLIAAAFFIYSHGKILTLLAPETAKGKTLGALDLLFDFFIRNNAGRPQILDFNTEELYPKNFGGIQKKFQQLSFRKKSWWKVF